MTINKLNSLKVGTRFQFTDCGGDIPTLTLIETSATGFLVLVRQVDGSQKVQMLPMSRFSANKVSVVV